MTCPFCIPSEATQNKIVSSIDWAEPPVEFEYYGFLFFIAILR
jgi:hypothetical protein